MTIPREQISIRETKMSQLTINPDGSVECHLTEEIERAFDLPSLGIFSVTRLTTVEWDGDRQEWVARLIATGEEVCSGRIRADVIKEEALFVESEKWKV